MDLLLSKKSNETIFPANRLADIIINSGIFEPADFEKLDNSIELLKQYDAIVHYRLEGLGRNFEFINNRYILPIISSQNQSVLIIPSIVIRPILDETITSIETNINDVSKLMGKRVIHETKNILSQTIEIQNMIQEIETKYYTMMNSIIVNGGGKSLSREEFIEFIKTEDFQTILNMQIQITRKGNLDKTIEAITEKPNISIEDIGRILDNPA